MGTITDVEFVLLLIGLGLAAISGLMAVLPSRDEIWDLFRGHNIKTPH